jgi:hypothetical protein
MHTGIISAVAILGTRPAVAVVGGGIAVLLGLIGFSMLLASSRQPLPERSRTRHRFRVIGSALLVALGGSALGAGIIAPLSKLKAKTEVRGPNVNADLLRQIAQLQSVQTNLLQQLARLQIDQNTRAILNEPKHRDPKCLSHHEYKLFSQNGEDGIIAEIFRRIGTTKKYFVEFGAADGAQNNTALLVRQGWSGLWMDADSPAVQRAKAAYRAEIAGAKLTVLETFITAENIEDLFRQGQVPEEFDLLSIDIDRNDYHVWEKITHYRPRVVVIEYNGALPPTMDWVTPYDAKAFGGTGMGNGNGASLKALERLGARKGYSLVGCDLCGVNAFFVRDDLLGDHFDAPYTAENHHEPFRYIYYNANGFYPPEWVLAPRG